MFPEKSFKFGFEHPAVEPPCEELDFEFLWVLVF